MIRSRHLRAKVKQLSEATISYRSSDLQVPELMSSKWQTRRRKRDGNIKDVYSDTSAMVAEQQVRSSP